MEKEKQAAVVEEPRKEAPADFTCPRCRWSGKGQLQAPVQDLEAYLRCALGGKLFTKSYELYGGKIKLTFSTCTGNEVDAMNKLLIRIAEMLKDTVAVQEQSIKFKLLYFLRRVEIDGKARDFTPPAMEEVSEIAPQFAQRYGALSETIIRSITQVFLVFMELEELLIIGGFDQNFWKGAGLR